MMPASYAVWAPDAEAVDLCLDGECIPLLRRADGWWSGGPPPRPGDRYGFSLDGGPPRADPRSGSQPDGPEGFSAVLDHGAFSWHDGDWRGFELPGSVLYELHVGTFSPEGTFDGVIERLDHLVALGVDAIEVMPIAEFPGRLGWGYDGVNLYAAHHGYGGPDGFKRLVDACHRAGLGVILDVVYNHLGPAGNYLPEFGPYFTDRYSTGWGAAVNFDGPESDEVRRWVIDNAALWLRDYHVDGLRLDAVHAIYDVSARPFLEQLADEVAQLSVRLDRPLTVIAESDRNDPRFALPVCSGGMGLDAVWSDDWHHAVHVALTGERTGYYADFGDAALLRAALSQGWAYDGRYSAFRRRTHGRSPGELTDHQFVVTLQNHDQVGNRALGERITALVPAARARIGAALLLTTPFTPMLFQGEEWGAATPFQYFTDHTDPELGAAIRTGRRAEFAGWGTDPEEVPDPQDPRTFTRSRLDWNELSAPAHSAMLRWYTQLIALRRSHPDLGSGKAAAAVGFDEVNGVLRVERGACLLLANLGRREVAVLEPTGCEILLAWNPTPRRDGRTLSLPPDAVVILGRRP
ncbi:MAG TPA: malto-oligosyltrehalose trehalohydrolase [Sporichthyaceae bacterium]|jgi:maltooligosyltrehalose trehalohydrolase|nr:malto-oligosyltrehalose trehalohydrolase [Sporichthyaceae bacterium]